MNTIMGVDLGTQSIKLVVYDPVTKETVATAAHAFDLITRDDGSAEQMAEWWLDGFHACFKQIDLTVLKTVSAIGVSGQQHGFVPVDKNAQALVPVKLWCDTSTVAECDALSETLGGADRVYELTGNRIAPGFTASKILWLKQKHPREYEAMQYILLPHDYLNFYLTGVPYMEYGDASGTGLLDVRKRCWSLDVLQAIDGTRDLSVCLPDLVDAATFAAPVKSGLAKTLGLQEGVLVSAGGGDNMMSAIGTANVVSGKLTASLGTSGTLFGYSDRAVCDDEGELAAFCSSDGAWLPLLCTMNCTVATEQLRSLLDLDVNQLEILAKQVPAGAEGVLTLPFYQGERTPNLPHGKAVIFGMSSSTMTKAHLVRSAMESAVFGLKTGMHAFQRCGMTFDEITLTGGGSKSDLWCQLVADILGLPVRITVEEENAAFGAALQALWCCKNQRGQPVELSELTGAHLTMDAQRHFAPRLDVVEVYEAIYQRYRSLLDHVRPLFEKNND